MDREQTRDLLSVLKANYPQSYKGWDRKQSETYIDLWAEAFKDDDAALVVGAVKSIIYSDTREFAPNIGQVKAMMHKLTNLDEMSEQEAWGHVVKAIRNGIYGSAEEFEKLPPICQRIVGSPEQIRTWAMMDSSEIHSVVASNFQRSYRGRAQYEKEMQAIPLEVKKTLGIEHIANRMRLESPKQKHLSDVEKIGIGMLASTDMSQDDLNEVYDFVDMYHAKTGAEPTRIINSLNKIADQTHSKDAVFEAIDTVRNQI